MLSQNNVPQWQQRSSITQQYPKPHNNVSPVSPSSPTHNSSMLSSFKASIKRKTSKLSSRNSWTSDDDRDSPASTTIPAAPAELAAPAPPHTASRPAELAAAAALERNPLSNPSPATRRPDRPGMNAFTVPSNEPPPAYTPSATPASGPTLGPSPEYAPPPSADPSTTSAPAEDRFSFLRAFDTLLLIDDSGSMAGRSWRETAHALAALLPIIVARDSDGIDLFFLNHVSADPGSAAAGVAPGGYRNVTSVAEVERIFGAVRPGGGTPTGTRCRAILRPYLAHLEAAARRGKIDDVKPLNILAITDGVPSDDVESVLLAAAKKLDALDAAPHQVGVQFFQVGNEEGAAEALKELDDGLVDLVQGGVRDMVDTCTWMGGVRTEEGGEGPKLTAEGMLKVVLGAVVKRLDRRRCSQELVR